MNCNSRKIKLVLSGLLALLFLPARATDSLRTISAGICVKKLYGFYLLNGISAEYSSDRILRRRLVVGFNYSSSRLGSAINSRAIPLSFIELFGHWNFPRGKKLQGYAGLNAGLATAQYAAKYKDLPDKQMLLSPELGLSYRPRFPLSFTAGFGYNLVTGTGEKNMGLVYPLFFQFRILYRIRS